MKWPVVPPALLLSLSLAALGTSSTDPGVRGRWVLQGPVHLGDPVVLESSLPVSSPEFFLEGDLVPGADWGPGRVVSLTKTPPPSFPGDLRLAVTVQVFATGTVEFPAARIAIRDRSGLHDRVLSPPPLRLEPLLPAGAAPRPPQAGPLPLPRATPWMWILLGAAALALGAAAMAAGLKKARARAASPPPKPTLREMDPPLWARREVERVFGAHMEPGARYETLSMVLRTLLEWRYGLPFLEWTGHEVRAGLLTLPDLPSEAGRAYAAVLELCDQVLYARHLPDPREDEAARSAALRALSLTPPKAPEGTREAA
ncbi:MAG: hypothetical protein AB1347_02445 [Acidobacteriota bacterium]